MVENRSNAPPATASTTTSAAVASATSASANGKLPESLEQSAVTPPANSAVRAATGSTPVTGTAAASNAPAGSAARASTSVETPLLPPRKVPTARAPAHSTPTTAQTLNPPSSTNQSRR